MPKKIEIKKNNKNYHKGTHQVVRFELLMDAGEGAQKAGDILINSFASMGKYVYIEPIIPAEISPPKRTPQSRSGVIIRIADFDITNIGNDSDLMLLEHEILLRRRIEDQEYHLPSTALLDITDREKNKESYQQVIAQAEKLGITVIPFIRDEEINNIIMALRATGGRSASKNMFYLGILSKIFCADKGIVHQRIRKSFKQLEEEKLLKNITLFEKGFEYAEKNIDISYEIENKIKEEERILIDGNSTLAMGIIDAGFKLFTGYPITPASSIMHTLAKVFPAYGGIVHQAEDEISAVGAALGGYYGGIPSITTTSGPGLSLKQEFIGLATVAEVPLVVIDVQRGGPSTGLPTRTEQGDLLAATFGSHGDNVKVVLSVSNVLDCFYAPHMARYLAEKLKVPVIILSDNQTATSFKVIKKLPVNVLKNIDDIEDFILERFHLKRLPKEIEMVKENQADIGTPGKMRRLVGLNTSKDGIISYAAKANQRSHDIRNEKIHLVRRALEVPEMLGPDKGDLLIVGWGSTRGALEEAIELAQEKNLKVSGMHFRIVYPFPLILSKVFADFKHVVTVEKAYGDELKPAPLAMLLRNETLKDIRPLIAETTGRPFRPRIILRKIEEYLK